MWREQFPICQKDDQTEQPTSYNYARVELSAATSRNDCGAAEIQRLAENAPRWPGMNRKNRKGRGSAALLNMASSGSPCVILLWLEALEGPANTSIQNNSEQFRSSPRTSSNSPL